MKPGFARLSPPPPRRHFDHGRVRVAPCGLLSRCCACPLGGPCSVASCQGVRQRCPSGYWNLPASSVSPSRQP